MAKISKVKIANPDDIDLADLMKPSKEYRIAEWSGLVSAEYESNILAIFYQFSNRYLYAMKRMNG